MRRGGEAVSLKGLALFHGREATFAVVELRVGIVTPFDVGAQEPGKADRQTACRECRSLAGRGFGGHLELHPLPARVDHLRGERALPHQFVDLRFVGLDRPSDLLRGLETIASRPNGLVRFLCVLDLALVGARTIGKVVRAVKFGDLAAGRGERGGRQVGAVGAHVGDEAVFVEALGGSHGSSGAEAKLAASILLQRRCHKRCCRAPPIGLVDE